MSKKTEQKSSASGVSPEEKMLAEFEGILGVEPSMESRPHNGGRFEVSSKGVCFITSDGTRKEVCEELRVKASTRDGQGKRWGLQLEWRDPDGLAHLEVMSNDSLQGDAAEAARFLSSGGLVIMPGRSAKGLLLEYLQAWKPEHRVRYVQRAAGTETPTAPRRKPSRQP